MTQTVLSHAVPLRASAAGHGAGVIETFIHAIRSWRMRVRTANQLSHLSDRMLDDIGLNRSDIENYISGRSTL